MMNTIYRIGKYELVKHSEGKAPFAIFCEGEQVSKWYCTAGWASARLNKLTKKNKKDLLK